jgi:hypothetical protein
MFTRRKQDAVCLQGGDYKRPPPTSKTCACTAADVECDYGYVMSAGICTALPQVCRSAGLYTADVAQRMWLADAG